MLVTSSLERILTPTAIALGNFDGVHRGHQQAIAPIVNCDPRLVSTVVSFDPHPQEYFSQTPRQLLLPIPEKADLLAALGVRQFVLLRFDADLARMSAAEFMQKILIDALQAQIVSVGRDFHFGKQRQGSVSDLAAIWGDRLQVLPEQVACDPPVRISSSAIRTALAQGEIELANSLLGRPYRLVGRVVAGDRLGRQLGFPTANLELPPQKLVPREGVYAASVGETLAVMNIGMRPTVNGRERRIEVHLLDWTGDLYGEELRVDLQRFLRPEKKFTSVEQLQAQIQTDCLAARSLVAVTKNT